MSEHQYIIELKKGPTRDKTGRESDWDGPTDTGKLQVLSQVFAAKNKFQMFSVRFSSRNYANIFS